MAPTLDAANGAKAMREFVAKFNVKNYFPVGRHGISHVLVAEEGLALPGNILVKYRDPDSLATRIKHDLRQLPPHTWPETEGLAVSLCISASTLRRASSSSSVDTAMAFAAAAASRILAHMASCLRRWKASLR